MFLDNRKLLAWVLILVLVGVGSTKPLPRRNPDPPPEYPKLIGIYDLRHRIEDATANCPQMRISWQDGRHFEVAIGAATGNPAIDWQGRGVINGASGYYDWVFPDGKRGRTTFTIDADGNLLGQVRGAGIDWDYVGKRKEGPVRVPVGE